MERGRGGERERGGEGEIRGDKGRGGEGNTAQEIYNLNAVLLKVRFSWTGGNPQPIIFDLGGDQSRTPVRSDPLTAMLGTANAAFLKMATRQALRSNNSGKILASSIAE
jgi:hypothetical protein